MVKDENNFTTLLMKNSLLMGDDATQNCLLQMANGLSIHFVQCIDSDVTTYRMDSEMNKFKYTHYD